MMSFIISEVQVVSVFFLQSATLCQDPLDVLGDNVDLEIYRISGFELRQVCQLPGFGNDGHLKKLIGQTRNGQAYTLDRNRAFKYEIGSNLARISKANGPRTSVVQGTHEFSASIDMPLNDMATQTCCRRYSAF